MVAGRVREVKARGGKFGVIGSNHTTNEENFFLAKFARQGLGTNNIDHHRTGDLATFFDALSGQDQRAGDHRRFVHCESRAGGGRGSCAAASVPRLPGPRQLPASRRAYLRGDVGSGARRQSGGGQRPRAEGRGSRRRRIAARQAEGRRRSGDRVRRCRARRRAAEIGRVRRFARHPGQVRLPGGLFEFARRLRYGRDPARRRNVAGADAGRDRSGRRCGWSARIR